VTLGVQFKPGLPNKPTLITAHIYGQLNNFTITYQIKILYLSLIFFGSICLAAFTLIFASKFRHLLVSRFK